MPASRWPPEHAPAPVDVEVFLAWIREIRFKDGRRCPRCSCPRVHRHGSFSGRQRYLCTGCRRTFSDTTGTPAAYIKKLHLWPAYGWGMEEGESLRAAADRLGVHPSTAFRWRHLVLDALRAADDERLGGWVECCLLGGYAESRKGERGGLDRPARCHGVKRPWSSGVARAVRARGVLVSRDRSGHVVTGLVRRHVPRSADLERVLGDRVISGTEVQSEGDERGGPTAHPRPVWWMRPAHIRLQEALAAGGPVLVVARARRALHGYAAFAAPRGGTVLSAWGPARADPLVHTGRARTYWHRLRTWMRGFYGVATRYLPNYLAWHRWLRRPRSEPFAAHLLRWVFQVP